MYPHSLPCIVYGSAGKEDILPSSPDIRGSIGTTFNVQEPQPDIFEVLPGAGFRAKGSFFFFITLKPRVE